MSALSSRAAAIPHRTSPKCDEQPSSPVPTAFTAAMPSPSPVRVVRGAVTTPSRASPRRDERPMSPKPAARGGMNTPGRPSPDRFMSPKPVARCAVNTPGRPSAERPTSPKPAARCANTPSRTGFKDARPSPPQSPSGCSARVAGRTSPRRDERPVQRRSTPASFAARPAGAAGTEEARALRAEWLRLRKVEEQQRDEKEVMAQQVKMLERELRRVVDENRTLRDAARAQGALALFRPPLRTLGNVPEAKAQALSSACQLFDKMLSPPGEPFARSLEAPLDNCSGVSKATIEAADRVAARMLGGGVAPSSERSASRAA